MDEKNITKTYSNGEVTIVWKPALCTHSKICWKGKEGEPGLPEVFKPLQKPWIVPTGASTERIVDQVNKCPSKALSFYYNSEKV